MIARNRSTAPDSTGGARGGRPHAGGAEPERIDGQYVSADYFRVLGVPPALGRDFAPSDDLPGRPLVALLFGVSPFDPVTYGATVALVSAVSLVACSIPAWRAARVSPSVALRAE